METGPQLLEWAAYQNLYTLDRDGWWQHCRSQSDFRLANWDRKTSAADLMPITKVVTVQTAEQQQAIFKRKPKQPT